MSSIAEPIVLVDLSVVLVAPGNDPAILNPDFLRYNNIVEGDLQVSEPPISTPAFSRIAFENGISVTAVPDRLVFQQNGDDIPEEDCIVPEIAARFLGVVRNLSYTAIGTNPKGILILNDNEPVGIADKLVDGGNWLSFRDTQPAIGLKAIYQYNTRTITMDVGEITRSNADGSESNGLFFQVNIHRDIATGNQTQRIERITSILNSWDKDMLDFNALVQRFNSGDISA